MSHECVRTCVCVCVITTTWCSHTRARVVLFVRVFPRVCACSCGEPNRRRCVFYRLRTYSGLYDGDTRTGTISRVASVSNSTAERTANIMWIKKKTKTVQPDYAMTCKKKRSIYGGREWTRRVTTTTTIYFDLHPRAHA